MAYECREAVTTASGRCWNATHDGADRCEAHGGPNGLPAAGAAVSTVISPRQSVPTVGSEIPYVTPGGRRAGTMRVVEVRGGRYRNTGGEAQDSLHAVGVLI